MPRPRSPHWHDRDRCYYTKVDGKRVMLRHPDGTKVAHGDAKGVRAAVDRLLGERDALIKRAAEPTVQDVCSDYLRAANRETTEETMKGKEWVLSKFCAFGEPAYGTRPAREIDSTHLHKMRKAWEKEGYASGMIRRLHREVMACWAWLSRPEPERTPIVILDRNPLAGMRLPSLTAPTVKYLRMDVTRALIAFAEARAAALTPALARFERQVVMMLRLVAETGCRPKEACSAMWADLDAAEGLLVLDPKRHKTGKKSN